MAVKIFVFPLLSNNGVVEWGSKLELYTGSSLLILCAMQLHLVIQIKQYATNLINRFIDFLNCCIYFAL